MVNDPFQLVGVTLDGRYEIESVVDETAVSVVYRAMHRVWQRPVAIKAFKASRREAEEQRALLEAFVREGALLGTLSEQCAAICQAREVGAVTAPSGAWVPFLVLEWLEGESLEAMLKREREAGGHRRSIDEAFALLNPVATALGLAHQHGVVHRDVKPGNVFVLSDPRGLWPCKLLDFGIAKVTAHGQATPDEPPILSFTPAYAAPEQFSSDFGETGPWTDAYALALIVVELLVGREALEGDTVGALAMRSCDPERRPIPSAHGVLVTPAVEHVLERALALKPEERYPDAAAFWRELETAMRAPRESAVSIPIPLTRVVQAESA